MSMRSTTHIRVARAAAVVVAGGVFGVGGSFALAAAERSAQPTDRQRAAESTAVAEWTRTQPLSGLSPASLTAPDRGLDLDAGRSGELAAIVEFAVAERLSGLSPASLRPAGD